MPQPRLWDYSDEDRAAYQRVFRLDKYDQKIEEREGRDGMIDRRLNAFVCSAVVLGLTRDLALLKLHDRALRVIDTKEEETNNDA